MAAAAGDAAGAAPLTGAAAAAAAVFAGGSEAELDEWLRARGVDTRRFGTGTAKSMAQLLAEVRAGEARLSAPPGGAVLREVSVVTLLVADARGRVLVEARQVMPSGATRERALPLSEKLLPGEGWRAAAARAVAEELGSAFGGGAGAAPAVDVDEATYRRSVEHRASQSYPGLASRYEMHTVAARVPGLPGGAGFETREARPGGELAHVWEWREWDWARGAAPPGSGSSGEEEAADKRTDG